MSVAFDLSDLKSVYFMGIGGVSMSSLALILKERGVLVSGYDFKKSEVTMSLEEKGIAVHYSYDEICTDGVQAVVYTAAISENDPVIAKARENGLAILSRAELLGEIIKGYRHSIGVAGTHGKSTTTGFLAQIMLEAKNDSTILGGAVIPSLGSTYRIGGGNTAVFEACEYKNSYHSMIPTVKVVLNAELDHVDFFGNIDNVISSFGRYMNEPGPNGENIAVVNLDCENAVKAAEGTAAVKKYFSLDKKTDIYAENLVMKNGYARFDVCESENGKLFSLNLSVPGIHNASNALAAVCAAKCCGVEDKYIKSGIEKFTGVKRRFEKLGTHTSGAVIVDDYAHHPDEIAATLKSARAVAAGRVICVFQPHTYSRTKALLKEFAASLSLADVVILAPIYAARETDTLGVSSADVASLIDGGISLNSFEEIKRKLEETAMPNDMIITMGAGDINKLFSSSDMLP